MVTERVGFVGARDDHNDAKEDAMTNLVSDRHPHEPEKAPVYDSEGRCLVCGCGWRDEEIARRDAFIATLPTPEQIEVAKSAIRKVGERMESDQTLENVGWDDITVLIDALVPIFGPLTTDA